MDGVFGAVTVEMAALFLRDSQWHRLPTGCVFQRRVTPWTAAQPAPAMPGGLAQKSGTVQDTRHRQSGLMLAKYCAERGGSVLGPGCSVFLGDWDCAGRLLRPTYSSCVLERRCFEYPGGRVGRWCQCCNWIRVSPASGRKYKIPRFLRSWIQSCINSVYRFALSQVSRLCPSLLCRVACRRGGGT